MPFPQTVAVPETTTEIVRRLENAGYETWCVGGALRDVLLGRPHRDFDLATAARPDEVRKLFRRTIPVGIEHGTVAVLDDANETHEVTTFRRDVRTDGRHAEVEFGVALEDDLQRRDFTINAIAYHPLDSRWMDPFDGAGDLAAAVVRTVGSPRARFKEDYLRILRAIRFATRLEFAIDPDTWQAALDCAGGLEWLSAERVRDEWVKSLEGAADVRRVPQLWDAVGATALWFPGQDAFDGNRVELLNRLPAEDPLLMTSFLAEDPARVLENLRCSRAEIRRAAAIAKFRDVFPVTLAGVEVRRWLALVGEAADDLAALRAATTGDGGLARAVAGVRENGDAVSLSQLAVTGDDLLAAGIPGGPSLGMLLAKLLEDVINDPAHNDAEYLLELAKREGGGG